MVEGEPVVVCSKGICSFLDVQEGQGIVTCFGLLAQMAKNRFS